ncbi:hypothetical protein BDM02DRAFT_2264536 [Thelephora ganbajun]|uniref:Uncharacterized protein n=1 Tax=Thelephora ganbajun TaxID=370292 RepID=A0ACB6ZG89_THEGA|nr:hypothetical protein BDM02DRAFT_2264536 [Thelephora ganbajun]
MFVPQVQQRPELGNTFAWWFHPRTRLPNWRIREIERQREMDRIAEPYIARLREVSRQKKVESEARALAGKQKADRKVQKELREIERQQRSEEKRQARKVSREKRRRRKSAENTPPEGHEPEVSISPRRKSAGRSRPYDIPHPATRSARRSHVMPGGFDSDDLTLDQSGVDHDTLWKGFRSAVEMGYRLWM